MNRHDRKRWQKPTTSQTLARQDAYRKRLKDISALKEALSANRKWLIALEKREQDPAREHNPAQILRERITHQESWLAILEAKPKVYLPPVTTYSKYTGSFPGLSSLLSEDWF